MTIVAQLSQGETCAKAAGTGIDHRKPMTVMTIGGTQMMCSSSLRGLLWLSPYSPNHCSTVRMARTLRRRRCRCKNSANKQGAGMPLMQRFMRFMAAQRNPLRCAAARALSAVRADAHQGAGDHRGLAHRAHPAAAQCQLAQSRRRDVRRLPGGARRSDRCARVRAGFPGLFRVDARHDDFFRSRR